MLEIIDEFFNKEAEGNTSMLKYTLIADYAASKGYSAAAYDFRRNVEVRQRIEELKSTEGMFNSSKPMVYKNLNVLEFISNNRNAEKLKKALIELDAYWRNIYDYANNITVKNKELTKIKRQQNQKIKKLTALNKGLENNSKNLSNVNRKLLLENRYLRKMLKANLYPVIANEILRSDELHITDEISVPPQTIINMTDNNYPKSFSESIKQDQKMLSNEEKLLRTMREECDV